MLPSQDEFTGSGGRAGELGWQQGRGGVGDRRARMARWDGGGVEGSERLDSTAHADWVPIEISFPISPTSAPARPLSPLWPPVVMAGCSLLS